jgi:hypothetical protein
VLVSALIVDRWNQLNVVDSYPVILLEIAIVLLLYVIFARFADSVPDESFGLSMLLSIPTLSLVGLFVWAAILLLACLLAVAGPTKEYGTLQQALHFGANHPLIALGVGPALALLFRLQADD